MDIRHKEYVRYNIRNAKRKLEDKGITKCAQRKIILSVQEEILSGDYLPKNINQLKEIALSDKSTSRELSLCL